MRLIIPGQRVAVDGSAARGAAAAGAGPATPLLDKVEVVAAFNLSRAHAGGPWRPRRSRHGTATSSRSRSRAGSSSGPPRALPRGDRPAPPESVQSDAHRRRHAAPRERVGARHQGVVPERAEHPAPREGRRRRRPRRSPAVAGRLRRGVRGPHGGRSHRVARLEARHAADRGPPQPGPGTLPLGVATATRSRGRPGPARARFTASTPTRPCSSSSTERPRARWAASGPSSPGRPQPHWQALHAVLWRAHLRVRAPHDEREPHRERDPARPALPRRANLYLVSHSRGGLVGDLVCLRAMDAGRIARYRREDAELDGGRRHGSPKSRAARGPAGRKGVPRPAVRALRLARARHAAGLREHRHVPVRAHQSGRADPRPGRLPALRGGEADHPPDRQEPDGARADAGHRGDDADLAAGAPS